MKNKQTNRRLLSLLLSLCLMLSLVKPAMAAGEETAGQETEQTTACPTKIRAVKTTLTATKLPEGSTLPKTITLVTPNVINVDKRSQIHMEISGLPAGEQFLLVLGEEILYTSWVNGCYFYDWSYGNSLETGSGSFTVKVQDSQYSEKNTVVYEMSEGESIPIYLATEDEFPVPALAQLTQEREKASVEQLNVQAWLNLPVGTLSEYTKSDLTMKLFDQSGALCGVSCSGQFYGYQRSMTDTRYDFFKTDHYYETSYECAYAQVYLGKPLTAGSSYTAAVYNGDQEIVRLENAVTMYDCPLVSASGNSGIAANTVGATTAYIQVGLVGGNPSDFGVKVYTKNGNCIGTSNEYRVEKTSSSDVRVSYIVPLTEALKGENYRVEVFSEKTFEYKREPGTLYVSDRALEDACFASHFYANVVLRSSGFDPQEIYPVQLKGNSGDTVLAETTASPDENGVWEIEFRGTDGQPYPIEANGGYRVVVTAKREYGGEQKYEKYLYNRNVEQITSSMALMSMAGEGNNEETPTTDETLPLTYQRASINAAVYDGVLRVWLNGLSETDYAALTKKAWQDLFKLRLTDMTGAETLTLSLNTQKSEANNRNRNFQFYFDASQLPKGCYGGAELLFDGKLVTDANGSGVFAANQYIIQNSGLPNVHPSNVGLSDRAVRYTTSLYAYNVGRESLTLQLFTAANRTAAADASITLDPGSGYEITADDLSAVNRYLRYSVNAALTSGPVGNASDYIYLAPSAFWNQSNESCTVKVDSSVEHGTLTLLAPEGMTEDEKYPSYTELYVLAEPAEGYRLKANSVRILTGTESYPLYGRGFPVLEDCTVTAEFEEIPEVTYAVTVKAADYEGTAIADKARAAAGETVTITAVPAEGYAAVDMYEHNTYYKYSDANGNTVTKALTKNADGTLSFVMPNAAVEVHVRFRQYGYVGVYRPSVTGLNTDWDIAEKITVTDANGNSVAGTWYVMKENQDIFLYVPQTMTGTYGTYTLNKAASYLSYNNKETNEEVKVWLSGLTPEEGKEDTYRFTLPYANAVDFYISYSEQKSYQVTVDAVANGTLTLDRTSDLYYPGETVTVTAAPASNYYASAVYARVEETGTDLTVTQNANGTWSFVMPDSAVKVWGTFEYRTPDSKTLTLLVEGETYGSLWDKWEMGGLRGGSTAVGSEVRFMVKVNDGAKLVQLVCIEDGSGAEVTLTRGTDGIYSFIMPNSDVTLKAVFAPESTGGEGSEIKDAVGLAATLGGKAELVDSVTVRLTADVTLTEPLRITGGTIRLLLDRYYIYYDNGTEAAIVVDGANADFTIDGVSRSSQDTVEWTNGIRGESGGALDVRSGKLTVLGGGYYGGVHIRAGASAVIQRGTPASGMMTAYEVETTIVSGFTTPALHIEKDGTADIRNAYFFFDGDNCIMTLPNGKALTDYTAGANILAYIREEDETLTQIKTDYANADIITVGVEGYSVTAAPAEGAVWALKVSELPAGVTFAIPVTAETGYTIKDVWYTTAASGGSSSGGSGTVVESTTGGATESSTSGGSSSGGSAAGGIWYGANSGRWYLNMPAVPITLHAKVEKLSESTFKVEFLDDNGQLIISQTVAAGGSVTAPDAPVRDGYTFIGWKDSTGTMVSDFTNITADMTLTAVYKAKQMTVTLFLDGGSFTDTKYQTEYSVQYGEEFVDLPPENALTREGYTFDGWYSDIHYEKQFTSESKIYKSLILYAKWRAIPASYAVDSVYDAEKIQEWNIWTSTESTGRAAAGSEVTFKFVAKAGFVCTELRCVGTSGRVYTIELGLSDYYDESGERLRTYKGYFTMPEEDITLTPVCVSAHGTITVKLSEGNITYVSAAGSEPWQTDYWMNGNSSASGTNTVSFSYLTNGTYLISGTTTSEYSFEKVVTLTENDPTQMVTITPEETYTVTGTLTNVPTGGVWLEVYRENGGCVASQWVDDGFFKFSIPAGTYTLRAFGKQEYPVRIGTGGTAEFTVRSDIYNGFAVELVRLPSVKVTISAEQQIGKYAYLLLEQQNGNSWQYISSTICASANDTEVWLEDVIPATGTYRLQLTDISRGYYSGYESFTSNEVQFEVAENAATTIIERTLSYSLPAELVKSLSGSVTVDRTEVYGGELVDLAIRWTSKNGDAVQPTFTLTLPTGVTLANSAQTTNLKPEKEATEGIFHVTLCVDENAAGALRIPVQATLGDEAALFGTANLSIAKLMITAPVQVRASEKVTVYGEAAEGELVTIRNADTGTILAVVQAKGRYYSAKLALTGSAALVAETADGTVRSAQVTVEVVNDPIAVTGVTYGAYGEKAAYNERLNAFTFWQYVDLYMMGGDLPVSVSFRGSGIQSVKLSFCGLTQTATQSSDGAWTTIFKEGTWGASGLKYLTADVTTADGETLHFVAAVVNLLIDPSGIVTDTNGDPLAGVTVYCQVWKDNQWVNFDAENYGQVNPQVTDESGRYGWMVPEGKYRILAVKEGYQTYDSLNDEMFSLNGGSTIVIPPVRTDINFSMAPDTSKSYTIFPTAVENATIHCDRSNAAAGENVTLKASAASGYMLEAIRVTGVDSGRSYAVSSNSNGSYSFTMPAERVSYSATLAEAPTEVSVTANGDIKVSGLKTQDIKLIAAFYAADGRMIAVTMPPLKVNGTEATAAVQMQNGAKLRVFLLNSETNAPLAQCASLDQTTT